MKVSVCHAAPTHSLTHSLCSPACVGGSKSTWERRKSSTQAKRWAKHFVLVKLSILMSANAVNVLLKSILIRDLTHCKVSQLLLDVSWILENCA